MTATLSTKTKAIGTGLLLLASSIGTAVAQDATPSGSATPSAACQTEMGKTTVPDGATGYTINSEASKASYSAREELKDEGDVTPIGQTNAVIGMLVIGDDGTPLPCSRIDVDLRTLATDQPKRDAQVQKALETDRYPVATFIVNKVEGLSGPLKDGEKATVKLIGDMTVHGKTKEVTWDAEVTKDGDKVTGTAKAQVTFDDFGVKKPVIGPVLSIEDTLDLAIEVTANAS